MIIESFLIGLVAGFLFYELTGLTAGGIIAPAYFALYIHSPLRVLSTLAVAVFVWLAIEYMSRYFIIYGRRRLLLAIVMGFCVKLVFESGIHFINISYLDLSAIGYIIPGLVANEISRQKLLPTLASIIIVTAVIYLSLLVIH